MQIIDFVYGASQFQESDVVRLAGAVGHHTIYFTLHLHGTDHHYSRSTERYGYVTTYADPDWKIETGSLPLEQYSQFLLTSYGLEYTDTTWRDIVTRFARLDEEVLGTLDWPLAAVSRESNKNGAPVMLRLFGSHEKAVTAQKQVDELTKDINAIQRVFNGDYMPYRTLKGKTQRKTAEQELAHAREESKQLRRGNDLDLFQAEIQARKERESARAVLRPLTTKLAQLEGRLANVTTLLDGGTRITTSDLAEFYTYFPQANHEKLETVEFYHHELSRILRSQLEEQQHVYRAQIEHLTEQIRQKKAHILALGESLFLDEETYNHALEVHGTVLRLEAQIKIYDEKEELRNQRKHLLEDILGKAVTGAITADFNAVMNEVNSELHPHGDRGSGAKSRHVAIFDVAMLRHTPLPFLIHDSAIIKLVGHAPVRELLSVYIQSANLTSRASEPKQVFFSFDATKAYGQRAEELVEVTRVIHLDDGARALYGFTWNTETPDENN